MSSNSLDVIAAGILTDAQLRATAIPVSVTVNALAAGAATEATLALIKAKTDNIDVALSTRTKAADQQHVIVDSSASIAVTGPVTDAQLRAAAVPVYGAFYQATQPVSAAALPLPTGAATETTLGGVKTGTDRIPVLGQALAAASLPVVLPAAQITTLTPPAAITGYALEAGHLATIDTSTAKIPSQGQAIAAASLPVVLTAIQVTALTPPAALTNFSTETGGNLAALVAKDFSTAAKQTTAQGNFTSIDAKVPALGQALAAASVPVVLTAAQLTTLTPTVGVALDATLTSGAQKSLTVGATGNVGLVSAAGAQVVDGSASTQPISAASLPLPSGAATAAKQPALGTVSAPSTDVISVQMALGALPYRVAYNEEIYLQAYQSNLAAMSGNYGYELR